MNLRRAVLLGPVGITIIAQLAAGQPTVAASPSPSPSAPSTACSTADPSSSDACAGASQQLINEVRQQLSSAVADGLRAEAELQASLQASAFEEQRLASLISAADDQIAKLDAEIQRLQTEIEDINRRIEIERSELAALARVMYSRPGSLLLALAQSRNLRDALTKGSVFVLAGMNAQDVKRRLEQDLGRVQSDRDKVQTDRDQQATQRDQLQQLSDRSLTLQEQSTYLSQRLDTVLNEIQTELSLVESQSPDVAAQVRASLIADTNAIIADAQRVTSDHVRLLLKLPDQAISKGGMWPSLGDLPPSARLGRLGWPIENAVLTQGFGPSSLSLEPPMGTYRHFHTGIDLAAQVNSPILAAANGVVTAVGRDVWGYGNYVVVSHGGGLATLYGHLNAIQVASGQQVVRGETIGLEGSTGISTGPHLHFEVRMNGNPVDPLPYLVGHSG